MPNEFQRDATQPQVKPALSERRVNAWIGKALLVKGHVVSSEDLVIDGKFEGTIEVGDHTLTIGVDAKVEADLVAKTITIEGKVIGNITARERLDVRATGSVEGDIRAGCLLLVDGAVIRGRVEAGTKGKTESIGVTTA